jgi:hypothetical protein
MRSNCAAVRAGFWPAFTSRPTRCREAPPKQIVGCMRSPRICGREVQDVIGRLKRVRPKTPELRESLQALIRSYSENAGRMRYDEDLRLGFGIGSGAVESTHKQVVHARFRQAGMRWSERGPVVC